MNSLFSSSSLLPLTLSLHQQSPRFDFQHRDSCCNHHCSISHCPSSLAPPSPSISLHSVRKHRPSVRAVAPSNEEAISVINFEDFMEKDWSFLETFNTNSSEESKKKTDMIISAGDIKETSKVLISIGSEGFVDQVVDSSPCQQLLVVHDSLLTLACIKEKYDKVNCWQGELINLPVKWASFDVLFLYFLPALPFEIGQVFGSLAKRCLPGARLVISHPEGKEVLEQQRQQFPDVIVSNLPDKMTLQNVASNNSFDVTEFVDDPGFYMAVLKFKAET